VDEAENELRDDLAVPGAENKQKAKNWLARLTQSSSAAKPVAQPHIP
jgi:hypothetical protein